MTVFTRTWNAAYEAIPADSDQISEGALRIRQGREDVRERGEVDHSWAGDVDDGTHLKVTFVDPLGAKPTQANDETYLYTKDVSATSELFFEDEAGNEVQLTAAGSTPDFPGGGVVPMLFYRDTAPAGWTIVTAVDEHSVRLTKGSVAGGQAGGIIDGTNNFSTQFALLAEGATPGVGDRILSIANLAAHDHGGATGSHSHGVRFHHLSTGAVDLTTTNYLGLRTNLGGFFAINTNTSINTGIIAGATSTVSSQGSGTAHGHTVDMRLKWAACIICTKN